MERRKTKNQDDNTEHDHRGDRVVSATCNLEILSRNHGIYGRPRWSQSNCHRKVGRHLIQDTCCCTCCGITFSRCSIRRWNPFGLSSRKIIFNGHPTTYKLVGIDRVREYRVERFWDESRGRGSRIGTTAHASYGGKGVASMEPHPFVAWKTRLIPPSVLLALAKSERPMLRIWIVGALPR